MPALSAPVYGHIYQRPLEGTAHIASYRVANYKHRLVVRGGFDTASLTLNVKPAEAEEIFSYFIGCVMRFHVDDPIQPIREGYIDRITYRTGGLVFTRSLENMANRINIVYYSADKVGVPKTEQTAVADFAKSQAIYGIKEMSVEAGIHYNDADKTHKTTLRNLLRTIRAWPQTSIANGSDTGGGIIEIELRGLHYMAWDWQNYKNTDPGIDSTIVGLGLITSAVGSPYLPANAASIYDVSMAFGGDPLANPGNFAFNISRTSQSGNTYWQQIQSIVEAGDGTNQWTIRIAPPNPNTGLRYVYYKPAVTTVLYQVNALRDSGRLRDLNGNLIPGWRVTADAGIQVMDVLIGYNQVGDDPRIGYIEAVEFDGETGLVSFQSGDNITMEGVLQQDRYFRAYGRSRFGANMRQVL